MIVAEYKDRGVVVRIHDECISGTSEQCLLELGRIVSNSYKRRKLEQGPSIAVMENNKSEGQKLT